MNAKKAKKYKLTRHPNVRNAGVLLISTPGLTSRQRKILPSNRSRRTTDASILPPLGVWLETTRVTPPVSSVFSPEELAERLAYYADRAERRLPLFTGHPPVRMS